ncbi:D-cysteine desulfhydrase [Pontiella desulfatans]|uniref:D-cysteine desulfhydrase n=1 Tax=Pontiella desulfatans TaxID=2750659 RepID=A0A6C2TYN6_PONDE|nr:pyridoxal-phosphate dependent enzyme [Pontiella desulfatans]VGO12723.1 D-cysteine desulfhydrase [Pontiella desulfatans]
MNDLFSNFPTADVSALPTPVVRLSNLGHDRLFMKCDNLSGETYGGNKIRKLDFLLGQALAEERRSVITYGAAGSNHALATAVCCRQRGLKAISILAPQETNGHVRKNLLMQQAVGAELILCPGFSDFPETTRQAVERCKQTDGLEPYIIPAGGTNATGALGFVNAALEMAGQIQPDVIYIPMGTGGTHAGLLVGLKLAGLNTRVEAVRVVEPEFRDRTHIQQLCDELCAKLEKGLQDQCGLLETEERKGREADEFPLLRELCDLGVEKNPRIEDSNIIIRDAFFGEGYGMSTPEAEEAVRLFKEQENVYLETTYTGKATAALLHDLRTGALDGQTVLYWNTLNSRDFSDEVAPIDFHTLPPDFHSYFSGEIV